MRVRKECQGKARCVVYIWNAARAMGAESSRVMAIRASSVSCRSVHPSMHQSNHTPRDQDNTTRQQ